jgi:hypothetical protein
MYNVQSGTRLTDKLTVPIRWRYCSTKRTQHDRLNTWLSPKSQHLSDVQRRCPRSTANAETFMKRTFQHANRTAQTRFTTTQTKTVFQRRASQVSHLTEQYCTTSTRDTKCIVRYTRSATIRPICQILDPKTPKPLHDLFLTIYKISLMASVK